MNLVRKLFVFFFVISQCSAAKVAIIGGGLAGMAALSELSDAHDVQLFEFDDTVGGRISSSVISGMYVNTGAATVPKYVDSALYMILKENVTKILNYDSVTYYEGDKVVINELEANSGVNMTDVLKEINSESLTSKSTSQSLYMVAYNAGLKNKNIYQEFQSWDHFDYEFSVPPQETPLHYANPILQYSEDLYPVLSNDLKGVIKSVQDTHSAKIETGAKVNEIEYNDNGVTIKYTNSAGLTKTHTADYVLVTVSIGVLQNEDIKFTPPLPNVTKEAIDNDYKMGKYLNIYADFNGIFWDTAVEHFAYIQSESGKLGSAIININSNNLRGDDANSKPYILQFVVVGDEADRVAELTSTELKNEISALVKKMWASATVPNNIYTKLFNTTNFYGSIATPTLSFNPASRVKVCSPLKNRVFFAGEVCSDKYSISAVAAYQSGLTSAGNINAASKGAVFPEYQMESTTFRGCTTKSAINYSPVAEVDDGSCIYFQMKGSDNNDETESTTEAFAKMLISFVSVFILFSIIFYVFYFTTHHFRKHEY